MSKTKEKNAYVCKTCGLTSTKEGHLCNPVIVNKVFKCEYCGGEFENPLHVCKQKLKKMAYSCSMCGRLGVSGKNLCYPEKIK